MSQASRTIIRAIALLVATGVPSALLMAQAANARTASVVVTVGAENPLAIERPDETMTVTLGELRARLGTVDPAALRVRDASSNSEIPSQVVDDDADGTPDALIFQSSFFPGETKRFTIERGAPAPVAARRVHVIHDAERDDMAWESDRIAFRTYGVGLAKLEPLVSSGVDVWMKSVRASVLDRWYAKKAPASYHHDTGEGADFFDVGPTLGAGGVAVWRNDSLYRPPNFTSWRIVADGPVRVIFEMKHPEFDAGGMKVSVIRRISLDAGHNLSRAVTTFHSANGAPIPYVIGLVKRAGVVGSESSAQPWSWLSEWGPVDHKNGGHGELGTAVVIARAEVRDWKETSDHYLAVSEAKSDQPVIEYIGAGWTGSGDFNDVRDWWQYLDQSAARIATPLRVTLGSGAAR
jgi:pectinesterase